MPVPTSYFVCKCKLQIGIPTDTLWQPFANRDHPPTGTPRVVIQCPKCKTLSNFWRPDYEVPEERNVENGWAFVTWLGCGLETCKSPVPVFAHKNAATTQEQDSAPSGATTSIPALYCRGIHPVAAELIRNLLEHLANEKTVHLR